METGGAPIPANTAPVESKGEVAAPQVKMQASGESTLAVTPVATGKAKAVSKRKRTMSGTAEYGRAAIDMGTGGRNGGKRDRSGTATSSTIDPQSPLLMYPVYDGKAGALVTGKIAREKYAGSRSGSSPRMQSVQICQRVLNHLLCDGALSLDDLSTVIPEVSRENLMAVLEILDVLGVVICFKCKQPPSVAGAASTKGNTDGKGVASNSAASSSSSSSLSSRTYTKVGAASHVPVISQTLAHRHTNDNYYAVVGFAKGTEFTQFTNLKEQLKEKRSNIHKIHSRVQALDELTRAKQPHTRVERVQVFKRLLDEISPPVQDDQLYRAILEQSDVASANKR